VTLTVLLVAIFAALCLQGLTEGVGQAKTTSVAGSTRIPGGGSIISQGTHGLTSRGLPARTVAFTFDDGPDPTWTPKVLAVLAREHVPATFFVVGTRAAQHPELVRQVLAQGHELGAHTWSHADLSNSSGWRRNLELSLEQLGLEGSAGVSSTLLRPPYSSGPDALTPASSPRRLGWAMSRSWPTGTPKTGCAPVFHGSCRTPHPQGLPAPSC
jgi:peptidoglycan/xylan/chitin deacetylase (PgdA/CDA1 family)